jgi:hypothetical protein
MVFYGVIVFFHFDFSKIIATSHRIGNLIVTKNEFGNRGYFLGRKIETMSSVVIVVIPIATIRIMNVCSWGGSWVVCDSEGWVDRIVV